MLHPLLIQFFPLYSISPTGLYLGNKVIHNCSSNPKEKWSFIPAMPTVPCMHAHHSPYSSLLHTYVFHLPICSLWMKTVSYSSLQPKHLAKCLDHSTESMFIEWLIESITQKFILFLRWDLCQITYWNISRTMD